MWIERLEALQTVTDFCGRVCFARGFARDEVVVFAWIIAMLSVAPPPPPSRAPAVTSLSRFPVRIILVFWAAELDTDPSSSTCQPSSIDHRSRNNRAEQYCLSIVLSSAIAFVEVRNICTDTRDTRKCLGTRCTHSLQVFVLFSYQLSSMLTLMCLLACFCLLKKQRAFLSYGGG